MARKEKDFTRYELIVMLELFRQAYDINVHDIGEAKEILKKLSHNYLAMLTHVVITTGSSLLHQNNISNLTKELFKGNLDLNEFEEQYNTESKLNAKQRDIELEALREQSLDHVPFMSYRSSEFFQHLGNNYNATNSDRTETMRAVKRLEKRELVEVKRGKKRITDIKITMKGLLTVRSSSLEDQIKELEEFLN